MRVVSRVGSLSLSLSRRSRTRQDSHTIDGVVTDRAPWYTFFVIFSKLMLVLKLQLSEFQEKQRDTHTYIYISRDDYLVRARVSSPHPSGRFSARTVRIKKERKTARDFPNQAAVELCVRESFSKLPSQNVRVCFETPNIYMYIRPAAVFGAVPLRTARRGGPAARTQGPVAVSICDSFFNPISVSFPFADFDFSRVSSAKPLTFANRLRALDRPRPFLRCFNHSHTSNRIPNRVCHVG